MTLPTDLTPYLNALDPTQGSRFGVGILLTWDNVTMANTVSFRGRTVVNMPLLVASDNVNYNAGDIVVIQGWAPEGRLSSWFITGRVVIPPITSPGEV